MTETALEMASRHVQEGRRRIERQVQIVARLQRDGHTHMLVEAEHVLQEMRASQAEFEARLKDVEGRD